MEFTLLAAAGAALGAVYVTLWWEAKRGNAIGCTRSLWDIALGAIIAGVFVGRLAAMISNGVNPLANPGDILIVRGGVATGWAAITAMATVAWLGRNETWPVFDGLAASSLAGLAGWHAGCVFRSACLGTATDIPWAMHHNGSTIGRHPVELYAAVLYLVGTVSLAVWRSTSRSPLAAPTGIALIIAGGVRLVTEPYRPSLSGGPLPWYVAAIVAGLGLTVWAFARPRQKAASTADP